MTEPLRTDPPGAGPLSDADREARIEQLLLSGLDHYFAGKHEQAINIWTRVAFLERGHGRARAYIERARGALAERQRESDELLHTGVEAYHAGDLASARHLLTRAVDEGGANETALMFLQRLGRLEAVTETPPQQLSSRAALLQPAHDRTATTPAVWLKTLGVSAAVAGAVLVTALLLGSWLADLPVAAPAAVPAPVEPLPIVRPLEMRIGRARDLQAAGRLHEALRLLDDVDVADPLRPDAERLRADLQRNLLSNVSPSAAGSAQGDQSR